jgi:glycosyltransferase involved in cell wall biosynthesis
MRILIACGASRRAEGGVAGVVYNLAAELCALGHSVDCLFREDLLPGRTLPTRFETVDLARAIARRIGTQKRNYDVVNIHAPYGFVYGAKRRWKGASAGPPYVMTMHGLEERRVHAMRREAAKDRAWYFGAKNRCWHRIYHLPTYRYSILTADQCVVLNREAWSYLQLRYGRDAERVWYVPNGVEKRFFQPRRFPTGPPRKLLFAGSWLDHKGVHYLRDAFTELVAHFPELEMTIACCGVQPDIVRRFFPSVARDRLKIIPFVPKEEMPDLYVEHDLFVFPSLVEGMPLVLLEAMASAMPVVTTDACGMADVVEDEHNGLLVKPGDAERFTWAVRRLLDSPELCKGLGQAAQATMKHYTWDRIAARFERVLWLALGVRPEEQPKSHGNAQSAKPSEAEVVARHEAARSARGG